MKLNRNSKKWVALYNERLKYTVQTFGFTKDVIASTAQEKGVIGKYAVHHWETVDAMPDRIKEAEEYADRLYQAMR